MMWRLLCWQVREFVREKVDEAVEAARREVDADELARIPRLLLEPLFLDLGLVSCDVKRDIILTNTGQVSIAQVRDACPSCQCAEEILTLSLIPSSVHVIIKSAAFVTDAMLPLKVTCPIFVAPWCLSRGPENAADSTL